MLSSVLLLATFVAESPFDIIGLVMAIVIVLIPLTGVLGVYFKLAKRPPHKPLETLPLADSGPPKRLPE